MEESKIYKNINKNFQNQKTKIEKFQDIIKSSIFGVLFVLLKEESGFSFTVETAFIISDLLQFFYFPFGPKVINNTTNN